MFRSLVSQVGGVDAACAAIEAAEGEAPARGTISKIQSGLLSVPLDWAHALEDASGNYAFTNHRVRQLEGESSPPGDCLYVLSGQASKESGEAISAGLRAVQSCDAGDHAKAAVEHREATPSCRPRA